MGFLPVAFYAAAPTRKGQQVFTSSGVFTVPLGARNISVVCVGGGAGGSQIAGSDLGGGGGALSYANNIAVRPGDQFSIIVGAAGAPQSSGGKSIFSSEAELVAFGGNGPEGDDGRGGIGAGTLRNGGGEGGRGQLPLASIAAGGGAGGYSGDGGDGSSEEVSSTPAGGGGAGGFRNVSTTKGGGGGGVGLLGEGTSGIYPSGGGSDGTNGGLGGGLFGGGAGVNNNLGSVTKGTGGPGAVRVIFGYNREFPSTNTGDL